MSTIQNENVPAPVVLTINFLTIAVFLVFMRNFFRIREKTETHYFLLGINFSALLYPIVNSIMIYNAINTNKPFDIRLFAPLIGAIYAFDMHWSATFAIFTYLLSKSVQQCWNFNCKKFILIAFPACVLFNSLFCLLYYILGWGERMHFKLHGMYSIGHNPSSMFDKVLIFFVFEILGLAVPMFLNVLFFSKVRSLVKASLRCFQEEKTKTWAIWRYPLIAIICFVPGLLADLVVGLTEVSCPDWIFIVNNCLHRAWAFFNVWVYWGLTTANNHKQDLMDEEHRRSKFSLSLD